MFVISGISLYRGSLNRGFQCSIHFTVTLAGLKNVFVISGISFYRIPLYRGSTVLPLYVRRGGLVVRKPP